MPFKKRKAERATLLKAAVSTQKSTPLDASSSVSSGFQELQLSRPILRALTAMNFLRPTPIQAAAIPIAMTGRDLLGGATTGSGASPVLAVVDPFLTLALPVGKTVAFFVPILERLLYRTRSLAATRVLVLLPTRELALQCCDVGQRLAQFTDIQFCLLAGGLPLRPQEQALRRKPDVLVATPGRLLDVLRNTAGFGLDALEILVLDEADRMLDIGFKAELDAILAACPPATQRQTMLFSATISDAIAELVAESLTRPARVLLDSADALAATLTQEFVRIREGREQDREALVLALCQHFYVERVIVFFGTKVQTHRMRILFGLLGLAAAELHGNLGQAERLEALEAFRAGRVAFLLATDVAARGLDIQGVQTVINFELPVSYAQYQHRIGRTARAGKSGRAVSLVAETDRKLLRAAIKNSCAAVKQRVVPSDMVASYRACIEQHEAALAAILEQEKQLKELAQADMELAKAQNMLAHSAEIYSRPRKSFIPKGTKVSKRRKHSNVTP